MNKFGWSYPPGAANDPYAPYNQEDSPCVCCGQDCYECICPECPYCGNVGDPSCYSVGHESDLPAASVKLEYNKKQLIGQTKLKIAGLKDQIYDHERYIERLQED